MFIFRSFVLVVLVLLIDLLVERSNIVLTTGAKGVLGEREVWRINLIAGGNRGKNKMELNLSIKKKGGGRRQ